MALKSHDDYWTESPKLNLNYFNFDDDSEEEAKFLGSDEVFVSRETDSVFGANTDSASTAVSPLHSLITKRNLDAVLNDVCVPLESSICEAQETIIKMFLGMPYSLHSYHSLHQKMDLLDQAVNLQDGNIILTILLYLKKTLKSSIFYNRLSKRKIALEHYISYLKQEVLLDELCILCMTTGNLSEIQYLFYLGCKDMSSAETVHTKLLKFLAEHQTKLEQDKTFFFEEYKNFLKWQIENKTSAESVIEELAFMLKKGSEKSLNNSQLISNFKQAFKISDFQYQWTQLNVVGALSMWNEVSTIFLKPNWLTKKKSFKSAIDLHLFIMRLHKHKAPKNILEEFLACMVDSEGSLLLAKKMECHKFVIDCFALQKDRQAILSYKEVIPKQSEEYFYAENALRSTDKKWKN